MRISGTSDRRNWLNVAERGSAELKDISSVLSERCSNSEIGWNLERNKRDCNRYFADRKIENILKQCCVHIADGRIDEHRSASDGRRNDSAVQRDVVSDHGYIEINRKIKREKHRPTRMRIRAAKSVSTRMRMRTYELTSSNVTRNGVLVETTLPDSISKSVN